MNHTIIRPDVKNFIKSLRDMGYNFEIAVADVLDNSITANATKIEIEALSDSDLSISILDNGTGMDEEELITAMRLGSKDPESQRERDDLGRFGLGLKTASFSQCKKLTVITKKDKKIYSKQWDLDYIAEMQDWYLISPEMEELKKLPQYEKLMNSDNGTLVIWEKIDSIEQESFTDSLYKLRNYLSLIFHRYLEGEFNKLSIILNKNPLEPFNPFNEANKTTQRTKAEIIRVEEADIKIQSFILPHHSKVSKYEYEKYAMEEGYTRNQGFYLYRSGRLLTHGTWWGLTRATEAHKLVRIKVDIPNDLDHLWNIDIKKSTAIPALVIKKHLKRIIGTALNKGYRVYSGRSRPINEINNTPLWKVIISDEIKFVINKEHPLFESMSKKYNFENDLLNYFSMLEAYLPITSMQSHLITEPHKINQENLLNEEKKIEIANQLKDLNMTDEEISVLLNL